MMVRRMVETERCHTSGTTWTERAAGEIPNAEFLPIGATDHLGVDTADIDPVLPAVLRTLREAS